MWEQQCGCSINLESDRDRHGGLLGLAGQARGFHSILSNVEVLTCQSAMSEGHLRTVTAAEEQGW